MTSKFDISNLVPPEATMAGLSKWAWNERYLISSIEVWLNYLDRSELVVAYSITRGLILRYVLDGFGNPIQVAGEFAREVIRGQVSIHAEKNPGKSR